MVVEDERPVLNFLKAALASQGYKVIVAETGTEGLSLALNWLPDLLILDLALPDMDGLEIVQRTREWSALPIIILSARGHEKDKVSALDSGADDYLTKPFGVRELLARVRVAIRHRTRIMDHQAANSQFRTGGLTVDLAARRVFVEDQEIHLTPIEYRLLATLVHHSGRVLMHRFLLSQVWGPGSVGQTHYLRVFMANLRRKIEADPARPRYLLTEQGVGYRLAED
ncbi:MAG: response regulator [Acidobacteriota bacterium]